DLVLAVMEERSDVKRLARAPEGRLDPNSDALPASDIIAQHDGNSAHHRVNGPAEFQEFEAARS
ncbi:MAG: hypothetical protein OXP11_03205, partial [Gammaproteobacteria bacterium]|nr:hypothetical protein [Gammaproteobacteria bacterium]